MRFLAAFGLLVFLATLSPALAQVTVSAQMNDDRSNFLLYERVDLLVSITNTSESDLVLDNDGDHPWLSFMVYKQNSMPVRPERKAFFKPVTLKMGETKTLDVNLTPLFSFREEGAYMAQAVISLPGAGDMTSQHVPFNVLNGHTVWSQQRPAAGSERTYSLIRFSPKPDLTELYLRVEDPAANLVCANIGLGPLEAYVDPQAYFDPQGNLHVLHLISMSTYLYSRINPDGKVLHQGVFKTFQEVPPRLKQMDDGNVYVAGGLEETPQMARESLSAGQRSSQAPGDTSTATIGTPPTGVATPISLPGSPSLPGLTPQPQAQAAAH